MTDFDLKAYLRPRQEMINDRLQAFLLQLPEPIAKLREAMEYSLLAGGKRLRPILVMAGAELMDQPGESVLPAALAMEFIHTYSLIHDDLPVMDDDDLRRGRPTCHKVYGEGMAVLTGDALLTEAFALIARQAEFSPAERVVEATGLIAGAAGANGMVGGQVADLLAEGRSDLVLDDVKFIHRLKTGALITVSLLAGAVLAGAGPEERTAIEAYGHNIGAAFQVTDDVLDIVGKTDIIGKPAGSDAERGKATWPAMVGLDESRQEVGRRIEAGLAALKIFGPRAEPLAALARYIESRDR